MTKRSRCLESSCETAPHWLRPLAEAWVRLLKAGLHLLDSPDIHPWPLTAPQIPFLLQISFTCLLPLQAEGVLLMQPHFRETTDPYSEMFRIAGNKVSSISLVIITLYSNLLCTKVIVISDWSTGFWMVHKGHLAGGCFCLLNFSCSMSQLHSRMYIQTFFVNFLRALIPLFGILTKYIYIYIYECILVVPHLLSEPASVQLKDRDDGRLKPKHEVYRSLMPNLLFWTQTVLTAILKNLTLPPWFSLSPGPLWALLVLTCPVPQRFRHSQSYQNRSNFFQKGPRLLAQSTELFLLLTLSPLFGRSDVHECLSQWFVHSAGLSCACLRCSTWIYLHKLQLYIVTTDG